MAIESPVRLASAPARTEKRYAALERYMAENVMTANGEFICSSYTQCSRSAVYTAAGRPRAGGRDFWRGQMSFVGEHYDLTLGDRPLRILFIAMETGRSREFVSLDDRRMELDGSIFEETFKSRNAHMRGTTSALRVLFGREPGYDKDGEWLDLGLGELQHLFDCFALANIRLCSAVRAGTTDSAPTPKVTGNCLRHLAATVKVLEPTICVLQSAEIRAALQPLVRYSRGLGSGLPLEELELAGVPTLLASFPHPRQYGGNVDKRWGSTASDGYLIEVVRPTLETARAYHLAGRPVDRIVQTRRPRGGSPR